MGINRNLSHNAETPSYSDAWIMSCIKENPCSRVNGAEYCPLRLLSLSVNMKYPVVVWLKVLTRSQMRLTKVFRLPVESGRTAGFPA